MTEVWSPSELVVVTALHQPIPCVWFLDHPSRVGLNQVMALKYTPKLIQTFGFILKQIECRVAVGLP